MRISDWSSDVCSSDLVCAKAREGGSGNGDKPAAVRVTITAAVMIETRTPMPMARNHERPSRSCAMVAHSVPAGPQQVQPPSSDFTARKDNGRASWREREGPHGSNTVVADTLKQ